MTGTQKSNSFEDKFYNNSMLGSDLNKIRQAELSKSSILPDEMDDRSNCKVNLEIKDLLDEKDRNIRKLTKRIEKLEQQLKRSLSDRNIKNTSLEGEQNQNMHFRLLVAEMDKAKRMEQIIKELTQRLGVILEELSHDNTLTENSQEIKEFILMLETSKNESASSQSLDHQFDQFLDISEEWIKKIDILEGAFKSYKLKFKTINTQNKELVSQRQTLKQKILQLERKISENQQVRMISLQLKQQKKQRQKMKKLLQKSQYQKNELINKINSVSIREDVKTKTKEQLLQYSRELNYRIKDLQSQKASILKQTTKEKQDELRKYQDFLKRLKTIKEKSIIGKSYG